MRLRIHENDSSTFHFTIFLLSALTFLKASIGDVYVDSTYKSMTNNNCHIFRDYRQQAQCNISMRTANWSIKGNALAKIVNHNRKVQQDC